MGESTWASARGPRYSPGCNMAGLQPWGIGGNIGISSGKQPNSGGWREFQPLTAALKGKKAVVPGKFWSSFPWRASVGIGSAFPARTKARGSHPHSRVSTTSRRPAGGKFHPPSPPSRSGGCRFGYRMRSPGIYSIFSRFAVLFGSPAIRSHSYAGCTINPGGACAGMASRVSVSNRFAAPG